LALKNARVNQKRLKKNMTDHPLLENSSESDNLSRKKTVIKEKRELGGEKIKSFWLKKLARRSHFSHALEKGTSSEQ